MNTAERTATLRPGVRVWFDGRVFTVAALEGARMLLSDAEGRLVSAATSVVVASRGFRVLDVPEPPADAVGAMLADLPGADRDALAVRAGHVREMLTGFRSGDAALAQPGEPCPEFAAGVPLMARYAAKSAQIGVTVRTLRRWAAAFGRDGAAGLVDGRTVRDADPLGGVDPRWLEMCRLVLAEHVEASRPTRQLVLARIAARLDAEYGAGAVPVPGRRAAGRVLAELSRGTNAFTGSTKGKREIANRPAGVYGRLRPSRPGEYVLVDTSRLDVFAMEPVTLSWVQVEVTVAMDLYSRCVTGLRLTPVSTKAVDAAAVLFECLHPVAGPQVLPFAGAPDVVVVDAEHVSVTAVLPTVAAETLVVDRGKIYLSEHLRSVCARLGISIQPARPLTPTDKAAIERFFKTLGTGLLAALPGYKGPDVYGRGADPGGCAFFFLDELEALIRRWIAEVYHRRPHDGLLDVHAPGLRMAPAEMFEHGLARAGRLRIPVRSDAAFDFLPVVWRTIQHYGVEVHGLRYSGPALRGLSGRRSSHSGAHAGKWPIRIDAADVSRVWFQHPADGGWHELVWEHHDAVGVPFSDEALTFARRLAIAEGRGVDEATVLAGMLADWDAGLVRTPAERRMAVRAGQVRAARLAATAAADLADPTADVVAAAADLLGDDDDIDELTATGDDESDTDDFYAGALEVLS